MERWEHLRRPLTPDTSPADLDELGREGWMLCGVERGVGWFRRPVIARELQEQGERQVGPLKRE